MKTIREAYGEALVECANEDKNIVVLDADVSSSTKTGAFAAAYPERFFNVGIAETSMVGIAAGLAATGKIPFANTFAVFMSTLGMLGARELLSYGGLNVKLAGAYAGLSDAFDGPTHHSVEDIAIMRSLPNMKVLVASDENITKALVRHAVGYEGPVYLRLSRDPMPDVHATSINVSDGRAISLRDGNDVAIIACGLMVSTALKAADRLADKGISARVIDMYQIKPLDRETVAACAKECGAIVTAEEHSVIGGLGGAVSEALGAIDFPAPLEMVGLMDCHAKTGPYDALLAEYSLDSHAVECAAEKALTRKEAWRR